MAVCEAGLLGAGRGSTKPAGPVEGPSADPQLSHSAGPLHPEEELGWTPGGTGLALLALGIASCLGLSLPGAPASLSRTGASQCGLRGLTEASLQGDGARGSSLRPSPALLNRGSEHSLQHLSPVGGG